MLSKTKVAQPLETPLGVGVVWPTVPLRLWSLPPSHLTAGEIAEADRCGREGGGGKNAAVGWP